MAGELEQRAALAGRMAVVVTAVVTAVVAWAAHQFGTQGRIVADLALVVALAFGMLIGLLVGVMVREIVGRPKQVAPGVVEHRPVEVEEQDPEGVDLVALIREVVAEAEPRFATAGTALQTMMSGRVRVDADPHEITADLRRLLDDSFEATKRLERGEVLVGLARKTVAEVPVARVTVTDNRIGATTVLTLPIQQLTMAE